MADISLRTKLFLSFVAVATLTGLMTMTVGLHLVGSRFFAEMQNKVVHDLNSGREIYNRAASEIRNVIALSSERFFIKEILADNAPAAGHQEISGSRTASQPLRSQRAAVAVRELEKIKEKNSLDMLALLDKNGKVVFCAGSPSLRGYRLEANPLINEVLRNRQIVSSSLIISNPELEKFHKDLAKRARIKIIHTEMAEKTEKIEEPSGLVIGSAAPVADDTGELKGVLFGGKLLTRNFDIVDKVKSILYGDMRYKGTGIGAVTIFQGDLRISTNVRDKDGNRAIGTRASKKVCDTVISKGKTFIGRAFVVNEWYLTAYEPIRDFNKKIVGMLFVGILERPYTNLKKQVFVVFISIVILGLALALALSYFLSGIILNPIKKLMAASSGLTCGDLSSRVRMESGDELGELGKTFNTMASAIQERDKQIKKYAQKRIEGTEKMATIGQLAAGVAHEINNPLGGILVYTHLLLEDTGKNDPRRENLEKVARETARVRDIVRGLLEFSRQTEPRIENTDINVLILKTLGLVERQAMFKNVKTIKKFDKSIPPLAIDKDKICQVLLNVVVNAAEAMDVNGGTLKIATGYSKSPDMVEIAVSDTGSGISPENLKRLFEPFFTTKDPGQGVGLGLAISYGIVRKHGGNIDVKSMAGKGTTVTISLPLDQENRSNADSD